MVLHTDSVLVLFACSYFFPLIVAYMLCCLRNTSPSVPSVSDADGVMKVTEIGARPLVQDLLNHDVCRLKDSLYSSLIHTLTFNFSVLELNITKIH